MLNCHEVTRLASEAMERPLSFRERLSVSMHTMMCSGCRNFRQQVRFLREMMRAFAERRDDEPR